jgi:ribose transport system ATP-binding protein
METGDLLEMRAISKAYPGVIALNDVTFRVKKGEVHALVGENGAGKSTLIKVLSGAVSRDKGLIVFDGIEYGEYRPAKAIRMGISVIYQEFNLIPRLSVAENVFLGKERRRWIFANRAEMLDESRRVIGELKIHIDPSVEVSSLSVAYQQLVEIIKALLNNAKLIVMDEPSATLTNTELAALFGLIRRLKEQGTSIVYISHRLEEIFEIADRVTVLRDGELIKTLAVTETDKGELIRLMVGRELAGTYPRKAEPLIGGDAMEVSGLTTAKIEGISFVLRKGEILGIAGLVGSGRTEVARAIFGADRCEGSIALNGVLVDIRKPGDAIRNKIGLIPEDRKKQGVFLDHSIRDNISLGILRAISRFLLIDKVEEAKIVASFVRMLGLKCDTDRKLVKYLSGGNQQKVVLAKWLATDSEILIFDEPTRGIDVGAKQEIYEIMVAIVKSGKSILMISSELPELLGMSDRIGVMNEGRWMGILERTEFSQERILRLSSGEGTIYE